MTNDNDSKLQGLVADLARKPGHSIVDKRLDAIFTGWLGIKPNQIDWEQRLVVSRGIMDAILGRTIIEIKSDLNDELTSAKEQLLKYLQDKEADNSVYLGIATDGALFQAYKRKNRGKNKEDDEVELIGEYVTDPNEPHQLLEWLEKNLLLKDNITPDGLSVKDELGKESFVYICAMKEIKHLWEDLLDDSEVQTKYSIWQRLLNTAYGNEVEGSDLFLQHTYLTIVAKSIATTALLDKIPSKGIDLLSGEYFRENGVHGAIESDFFDWILSHNDGDMTVMRIARSVQRFKWSEIEADILKVLYENLIDPAQRHMFGEYYTPDWLAENICRHAIKDPLNMRIIDPSCGSGTFLFHAIRLGIEKAKQDKIPLNEAAQSIAKNIAGIDVHPIAVIFARVTYLLALLPALQEGGAVVNVSVYMGDSLQWNLREFMGTDDLEIEVPMEKEGNRYLTGDRDSNGDNTDGNITLKFPNEVAETPALFDEVIAQMLKLSALQKKTDDFSSWLTAKKIKPKATEILSKSYSDLCYLQEQKRNHIWGYVARNLSRPIWLSGEKQKADIIIGNPPWLPHGRMGTEIKKRFREEVKSIGLWVGGKVISSQDLSSYFFVRSCELYMKKGGAIAFVLPYAALAGPSYKKFITGAYLEQEEYQRYFKINEAWAFSSSVLQLFPVPCCVLFAQDSDSLATLPETVIDFSGELPRRDASREEAKEALDDDEKPWPEDADALEGSAYKKQFKNGAQLAPRRLNVVNIVPNRLFPNPEFPLVEGRTSSQDKKPWNSIKPPKKPIEKKFIFPAYLGESIAPYRIMEPCKAVIPWDDKGNGSLLNSKEALSNGHTKLHDWLEVCEAKWNSGKLDKTNFKEHVDHHGCLSRQFPIAPIRVVYATSGSQPAASILRDDSGVIDTTLYWMRTEDLNEAHYLSAILNSETARAAAQKWQAQGQWGARHFHKVMFNLPIPPFNKKTSLHRELAKSAEKAEKIAYEMHPKEKEHFTRFRKRIRNALIENGVAGEIDKLVAQLLKLKA